VRIYNFDAQYFNEYWEIYILAIDPQKTSSVFTVIFVNEIGEHKIYLSNVESQTAVLRDLKKQLCETGFNWCTDNVQELFTSNWINQHMLDYDKKECLLDNVWEIIWNKNYYENEFSRLRCLIVKN
jgi:hypothetical protein